MYLYVYVHISAYVCKYIYIYMYIYGYIKIYIYTYIRVYIIIMWRHTHIPLTHYSASLCLRSHSKVFKSISCNGTKKMYIVSSS